MTCDVCQSLGNVFAGIWFSVGHRRPFRRRVVVIRLYLQQESSMHLIYLSRLRTASFAAVAAVGLAASASAQDATVIIAPNAPPPPRVESVPPPPQSPQTMSWQAGHWTWNGTAWAWDEGHYVQAPQAAAVWEPGHWSQQPSGGYVWVDGHWRS
jgi:hypothetical protein